MRAKVLGLLLSAAVVTALAVPAASAAEVTDAQAFEDRMIAAIDASGVWSTGTTLTESLEFPASPAKIIQTTSVNPDGSMTASYASVVSMVDVVCSGIGSCWERATGKYVDAQWHAIPATAVHLLDGFHGQPFGFPFGMRGATYDITDQPSAVTVFTMVDHADDQGSVDVTYQVTISPNRMEYVTFREGWPGFDSRQVYQSQVTPVPVSPPAPTEVGRPGLWTKDGYIYAHRNMPRMNGPAR